MQGIAYVPETFEARTPGEDPGPRKTGRTGSLEADRDNPSPPDDHPQTGSSPCLPEKSHTSTKTHSPLPSTRGSPRAAYRQTGPYQDNQKDLTIRNKNLNVPWTWEYN
jgi:hypothetical protein